MPLPVVGTPEWWLDRLGRRLTERAGRATFTKVGRRDDIALDRRLVDATGMALYQAYYEGRHRETYKIRRVIEAFGLRMPIYVNYAGVVVDSISERLGVDGFTFGGDDRASAASWEIWQDNNLDAGFKRGMRSGLIKGEFSLVLWPDEDWAPRIWVEDGAEVITSVHPETGVRRAALKRWADEDEPGAMFANLFLPDAVYKYRTPLAATGLVAADGAALATVGGTAWERRIVAGEPWPLPNPLGEVPVIPFPNKPDLHLVGESELGKVVPIQDAINANIANVMLAGLYGAFRQKVMLNFALEVDPATGAPVQPFDVALDSLITVPPNAPGEPEPRLAEFSQTDLAGYIKVHETLVQAIIAGMLSVTQASRPVRIGSSRSPTATLATFVTWPHRSPKSFVSAAAALIVSVPLTIASTSSSISKRPSPIIDQRVVHVALLGQAVGAPDGHRLDDHGRAGEVRQAEGAPRGHVRELGRRPRLDPPQDRTW